MTTESVNKFLKDIHLRDQERFKLVKALRELIIGLTPAISEEIKYDGILFSVDKHFCGIFSHAKHVSLEFVDGFSLPDKFKMLEGAGKLRRHIKLISIQDISAKHVREYLVLALKASFNS